jgi:hypothetical protein
MCASAGAADAQPDRAAPRAADRGLRAGSPGVRPRRISAELAREKWGWAADLRARRLARAGRVGAEHARQAPGLGRASPRSYERVPSPRPAFTRRTNWRTPSTIVSAMTFRRCAGSSDAPPRTGSRSTATSPAQRTPRGLAEAMVAAASCTALAKAGRGACFPGRAPAGSVAGVALAADDTRARRPGVCGRPQPPTKAGANRRPGSNVP